MTAIGWTGFRPVGNLSISAPAHLNPKEVSIVIPVRNNPEGISSFLKTFSEVIPSNDFPKEIVVVDNASDHPIKVETILQVPVVVSRCEKIGPACSRNHGVRIAKGTWILFTDSDCIPTASFISGYQSAFNGSLGYAGMVRSLGNDLISKYYDSQQTLVPEPIDEHGMERPEYLITSNCLIWKKALEELGGFDETISIAAGEDIDIGFRLREIGKLSFASDSLILHNFDDGMKGFRSRFFRYGMGNRFLAEKYDLELRPRWFLPRKITIWNIILAWTQFRSMLKGWKSADPQRKAP